MTVSLVPGTLKKFRRTPWRFQQTVERPSPDDLDRFVSVILAAPGGLEAGTVTIDDVIFNTMRLSELCPAGTAFKHDTSISAGSTAELQALLVAAILDGPDFICIPMPKPFVFYADHDDWITFYANTRSNLNHVIEPLAAAGYKVIENWQREL